MMIVSYDIADDKLRNKFSKFLSKFGFRLQYSVFQIKNSDTVLRNIKTEIDTRFLPRFTQADSVVIFQLSETCKITRYGHACNDESDFIVCI